MMYKCLLFVVLLLSNNALLATPTQDVVTIKKKLYELALQRQLIVECAPDKPTETIVATLNNDGKWTDILYTDKTPSKWQPANHWKRLLDLAIQYKQPNSKWFANANVRQQIISAINAWLNAPPVSSNYWWNAIGIPNLMGAVFILMENDIDHELINKSLPLMQLGVKPTHYEFSGKATGQNLLWIGFAHLYVSCLTNDTIGIKRVVAAVSNEIKVTELEGIQPDFSFHQHGKQNYAMGYGKAFAYSGAVYFYVVHQTAFEFSKNNIATLSNYLLQGLQWMSRYNYLEYTAMGREIARQGSNNPQSIQYALQLMAQIDKANEAAYMLFNEKLAGVKKAPPLIGNRYFWHSDLMVHQRKEYYFSLKATSDRTLSGESGNGENIKGAYQGNGTYYLIRSGKEYENIFPIWNWKKIPGLLINPTIDSFPLYTWGAGAGGATSFVYGISDSMYGCFSYDYKKEAIAAHRAWFMFDKEIVCLASGILGSQVYQSINQSILKGTPKQTTIKNASQETIKVFHDSTGYIILASKQSIVLDTSIQTGSWKEINTSASDKKISNKVFSLGLQLNDTLDKKAFAYAILPAIDTSAFNRYEWNNHISILNNTPTIQAVFQKELQQVQAIFYEKATLNLPWKDVTFTLKTPGLVIVKKAGNQLSVLYQHGFIKKQVTISLLHPHLVNKEIHVQTRKAQ